MDVKAPKMERLERHQREVYTVPLSTVGEYLARGLVALCIDCAWVPGHLHFAKPDTPATVKHKIWSKRHHQIGMPLCHIVIEK